jgi:hypothetical protein
MNILFSFALSRSIEEKFRLTGIPEKARYFLLRKEDFSITEF